MRSCLSASRCRATAELVEAAFDDIAASIAFPLNIAELDRPTAALATVGDLVGAFRNRRSDPMLTEPCVVRSGWVPLVRHHPVRSRSRPATPAGHPDLLKRNGQHAGVRGPTRGQNEREGPPFAVADQVVLGRQPAPGTADRVIRWLRTEFLVVRQSPLWCGEASHRAGARE